MSDEIPLEELERRIDQLESSLKNELKSQTLLLSTLATSNQSLTQTSIQELLLQSSTVKSSLNKLDIKVDVKLADLKNLLEEIKDLLKSKS